MIGADHRLALALALALTLALTLATFANAGSDPKPQSSVRHRGADRV